MNILAYQLSVPAPIARGPYADLSEWAAELARCPFQGQIERALWGGFHADRLGYAFVAGYSAALLRLFDHAACVQGIAPDRPFPARPLPARLSLCATESGGAHPRAIATRLDERGDALILNGEKTYATLASRADELLVVATRGVDADGRSRLRLVRVAPSAPGVQIIARPNTPFAPEIPHAIVRFTDVVVASEDVLPGDGYEHYLKPFRTIEDTHVLAATIGYLQGAARQYGFARDLSAELVSVALSLIDVGTRDASAPLTHIALAGLFGSARRLIDSLDREWARAPEEERERWQRDRALLMIAEGARAKRTEVAWARVGEPTRETSPSSSVS